MPVVLQGSSHEVSRSALEYRSRGARFEAELSGSSTSADGRCTQQEHLLIYCYSDFFSPQSYSGG